SANDYDYANGDPVNGSDLDGSCGRFGNPFKACRSESGIYPGNDTVVSEFSGPAIGYPIPLRVGQHGQSPEWGAIHILKNHPMGYNYGEIQRVLLQGRWKMERPGVYKVVLREQRTVTDQCGCSRNKRGTFTVIVDTNPSSPNGGIIGVRNAYSRNWW
ncbi:MAG: hypothetical protein LC721_12145, partial [Actinobacteria bacterium]|nr:hypothetical protein [Actinomycetota bacterium]